MDGDLKALDIKVQIFNNIYILHQYQPLRYLSIQILRLKQFLICHNLVYKIQNFLYNKEKQRIKYWNLPPLNNVETGAYSNVI